MNHAAIRVTDDSRPIPADFPFASKFVTVHGSTMHYVDEGEGKPILFIHGSPASSYLWRNILPHLEGQGRCIALDLIGMGKSDRPDIAYTYDDHLKYLDGFIEALDLGDEITLVIHDWGSMLGFRWASLNPERVRAIAFMEAMVRSLSFRHLPAGIRPAMRLLRIPFFNWLLGGVANMFVKQMLPDLAYRPLSRAIRDHYEADYSTVRSRIAVRTFPREVPFDGFPKHSHDHVTAYIDWLAQSDKPMLVLHGDDGVVIKAEELAWLEENIRHLEVVDLGPGKHFLQEAHPDAIGSAISSWFSRLPTTLEFTMSRFTVRTERPLPTDAATAWEVFGEGFADWASWAPGIDRSTLEGPLSEGVIRVNETPSLGTVRQSLARFDRAARTLAYEMLPELPPPFVAIRNDWVIEEDGSGQSKLVGEATFEIADEAAPMQDKLAGKMGTTLEVFANSFVERLA